MAIIDSKSYAKFDALIRTNKADSLMAFIMATYHSRGLKNHKEEVAKRLKSSYELFRDNIANSDSGAGTYGAYGEEKTLEQFESHYTMGYEMGIWKDSELTLSDLAILVAEHKWTVREYISAIFSNLFTYYEVDGEYVYHHFLYEVLKAVKREIGNGNEVFSKSLIINTLPEHPKRKDQGNILYNYLTDSSFFSAVGKSEFEVSENWKGKIDVLFSHCNLSYKNKTMEEAFEMARDRQRYVEYVTDLGLDSSEDKVDINYLLGAEFSNNRMNIIDKPHQRIFFGAPGTGKSYRLNQESKEFSGSVRRVTFHPSYLYGNFIGSYKPKTEKDGRIVYKYVPGILLMSWMDAIKNSDKDHLLIIEEINRANVSSVFGDFFQLLDREEDGNSTYKIALSDELKEYLVSENIIEENVDSIGLPGNLYIWATMNSADQGVMPLDTAFKRRWTFTYIGVNEGIENEEEFNSYMIQWKKNGQGYSISWNKLRQGINSILKEMKVPEDKMLGPYFLTKKELLDQSSENLLETICSKVLMYLYEDALRPHRYQVFNEAIVATFSDLCKMFESDPNNVFNESFNHEVNFIELTEGEPIAMDEEI